MSEDVKLVLEAILAIAGLILIVQVLLDDGTPRGR